MGNRFWFPSFPDLERTGGYDVDPLFRLCFCAGGIYDCFLCQLFSIDRPHSFPEEFVAVFVVQSDFVYCFESGTGVVA